MSGRDGGPAFPIAPDTVVDGVVQRFLRYVPVSSPDVCWLWSGGTNPKGYGIFAVRTDQQVRAHRYAYELATGREPGRMVLHSCDEPGCVNPAHLSNGDHAENMRQMAERRRAAREERHHKAKLSRNEALAVLLLCRDDAWTTYEVADLFGISQPSASAIATGRTWPDLQEIADAMLKAREEG